MTPPRRDLLVAAVAAFVCAGVTRGVSVVPVQALFAVPLALLLPGYALTAATFARHRLAGWHVMLLSLALSLAVLATGGLLLNLAPEGIRGDRWAALLVGVVSAGCGVAALRRPRAPGESATRPPAVRRRGPSAAQVLMLAGTALSLTTAVVISRTVLPAPNAVGYTQLWMLPVTGGPEPRLVVGVTSAETITRTYRLELTSSTGRRIVRTRMRLRPGQRAQFMLADPAPRAVGAARQVTLRLYRLLLTGGRPANPYRRVTAWLPPPRR